jgi:hypothetical protein
MPHSAAIADILGITPVGGTATPNGIIGGAGWLGLGRHWEARGTTTNTVAEEGTVAISRYARFSGRAVGVIETQTDANGNAEVWIFVDPTDLIQPVKVIQVHAPIDSNYTDMTIVGHLSWSSDPYPFAKAVVAEAGDTPCTGLDTLNSYYLGGACLEVTTLNKSAYLSTAYQTRTGDNTPDRFMSDLPTLWATSEPTAPLGLRDTPVTCMGAVSAYTGASWHVGTAPMTHEFLDDEKYYVSSGFRRCWAFGAPWIRVLVRTTNLAAGSGPCQFNVTYNCWAGTAPITAALASSQPFETVPLEPPTWLRALKTRGCHFKDSSKLEHYHEMMRQMSLRIPAGMAGDTPLQRAIVANPKQTLPALLAAPAVEKPAKSGSWVNDVESVISKGFDLGLRYAPSVLAAAGWIASALA